VNEFKKSLKYRNANKSEYFSVIRLSFKVTFVIKLKIARWSITYKVYYEKRYSLFELWFRVQKFHKYIFQTEEFDIILRFISIFCLYR